MGTLHLMLRSLLFALFLVFTAGAISQGGAPDLFLVVDKEGAFVTLIDGERLEPVRRFATHRPVAGPPHFAADARFAFFGSVGGWITKYDLQTFVAVAEAHVGAPAPRFAVSADGRHVAAAGENPPGLVILDADLRTHKRLAAPSRISAVFDAGPRRSFIVAFEDLAELWEVSYDPAAEPIAEGIVHDFRLKEGTFVEGFLNARRTKLDQPLSDLFFVPEGSLIVGMQRDGKRGQLVQLDVRRKIATVEIPGVPHFGASASWVRNGRRVIATPDLRAGVVSIVDSTSWSIVERLATPGPASFLRTNDATRSAWIGAIPAAGQGGMLQVIDQQTLEVVATLAIESWKADVPIEFDRRGRYALTAVPGREGGLIVFDTRTLRELKRIPVQDPSGIYNVPAR